MTDTSSLHITQSNAPSFPVVASPVPNGSPSDAPIVEEEEYTIKCICIYADDDGNTVYCPKCDTWQHIECYYQSKKVPEEHFCADCWPRDLDAKRATERQRRHREALDGGDRKVKRPSTKGQKKKHKDSIPMIEQTNGWHLPERHDSLSNGKDQPPPPKKPKTSHRSSSSINLTNGESRKRASSNVQSYPSPSKSPQELFRYPSIPLYTPEFLELYDRDDGQTTARGNEHTIQALNKLSEWRTEPSMIVSGTGVQPTGKSPFVRYDKPLDQIPWPKVSVETVQRSDIECDGRNPTWRYLKLETSVKKDDLIGEIRGEVGMLDEYCSQKSSHNRWHELRHPDPFVFFHPHMNIYIDSRKNGTQFRYLRRSCTPNVTLKTIVSEADGAHHFFVASKDISAGTELTAPWYLDPCIRSVDTGREDTSEQIHNRQQWVSRVLANFGDCACDAGQNCLLSPLDRRQSFKSIDIPNKERVGRKKKRTKHNLSPLSTGQATNSRAGSEALKIQDDDDQFDHQSTSDSSRSGPRSRDLTPVNIAALDADPLLGANLTARELRKIQAVEKAFERKEQEQGVRKKKRTSGGSNLNTPSLHTSRQLGNPISQPSTPSVLHSRREMFSGSPPPSYSSNIRQRSGEPSSKTGLAGTSRPGYRNMSVQTDDLDDLDISPPAKRRKFSTPAQRLLRRVFMDRVRYDQQYKQRGQQDTMDDGTQTSPNTTPVVRDVEMMDVEAGTSPDASPMVIDKIGSISTITPSMESSPIGKFPLPSQFAHTHKPFASLNGPRLQLGTLPPVPLFTTSETVVTPSSMSVTPAFTSPAEQSPLPAIGMVSFSGLTALPTPSPAKKKLSLGDYTRRKLAATPTTEKSQNQTFSPPPDGDGSKTVQATRSQSMSSETAAKDFATSIEAVREEAATKNGLGESAVTDMDGKEEGEEEEEEEAEYSPPDASSPPVSVPITAPVDEVQSTNSSLAMTSGNLTPDVARVMAQLVQMQKQGVSKS